MKSNEPASLPVVWREYERVIEGAQVFKGVGEAFAAAALAARAWRRADFGGMVGKCSHRSHVEL